MTFKIENVQELIRNLSNLVSCYKINLCPACGSEIDSHSRCDDCDQTFDDHVWEYLVEIAFDNYQSL